MNSCYANLAASKARYREKLNRKSEHITELGAEVSSLQEKYGKAQEDCSALDKECVELQSHNDAISKELEELRVQFAGVVDAATKLADELALTDAKLFDQALVVRDLHNELVFERSKSQEYKDAAANADKRFNRLRGEGKLNVKMFNHLHATSRCVMEGNLGHWNAWIRSVILILGGIAWILILSHILASGEEARAYFGFVIIN
ncbi:alpha/beta hydrolases superfamily protein [Tanacetum coccineum]|uniref:SWI5-dependent HO expression protein 3 n=1 Tax=Tanacetum coccineum TaxID=301880 RepID=A0ABQ5IQW5_9ASTR